MKINNKGFMLAETLICATIILGILIFVFTQFKQINSSYDDSFKYNTINNLYLAEQARSYLKENNLINTNDLNNNYVEINFCQNDSSNYCLKLLEQLNINKILFAPYNFRENIPQDLNISPDFLEFIKKVNLINEGNVIFIEFKDNTYAILKVI